MDLSMRTVMTFYDNRSFFALMNAEFGLKGRTMAYDGESMWPFGSRDARVGCSVVISSSVALIVAS